MKTTKTKSTNRTGYRDFVCGTSDQDKQYLASEGLTPENVLFEMTAAELMDSLLAKDVTESNVYSDQEQTWTAVEMSKGMSFNDAVSELDLPEVDFSGSPEVDSEEEALWLQERAVKIKARNESILAAEALSDTAANTDTLSEE